jgi:rhamnose utilization protein RhaD (predicted bifunctional aldolase and dehydrogenase)
MISAQPSELTALAALSACIGVDIALVQAAGGNSSIKLDGVLWVKASGTWLADAERKPIFVPVDLAAARAAMAAGVEKIPAVAGATSGLRPSIETSLHAFMPHRVVLHVHAVNTIAWAARMDVRPGLELRLAGLAWAWLPYCRPGLPLTLAVAEATAGRTPDVLILGNHGLVVGAADCDAAAALMRDVEHRLALDARPAPPADPARLEACCRGTGYRPAAFAECHAVATDAQSRAVATGGTLYPDHVVFLGPGARALSAHEDVAGIERSAAARHLPPPGFLLVSDAGTVLRADLPAGAEPLLRCLGLVTARLPAGIEISYLSADDERDLMNWDAEHYRKSLSGDGPAQPA